MTRASSGAHLTAARLAAIVGAAFACAVAAVILCPLLGVDTSNGWSLELMSPGQIVADGIDHLVFVRDRLPRALAAAVVGAGLAAAGCTFQAVLRNPLAEPFTLGISSGASLAAVIAIRFGAGATFAGESAIGVAALLGAGATVILVWRLARVGGAHPPATLLLAGITIAMVCSAASLLLQYTANYTELYRIVRWMMGGLDWIGYPTLAKSALLITIGVLWLLTLARDMNALAAGADAAASVGVDARRSIRTAFTCSSLVVGAGIAIAGPIGFIGLMVPHALRAIIGPDHRALLPASALVGAAALVVCDTVARIVIAPAQLPVGVVTALLGGPFFLYLLVSEKSRGRLWGGS